MIASDLSAFECVVPATVEEALRQRAETPGLSPIAGGTEVMVLLNEAKLQGRKFQSLHRLAAEWRYVRPALDGGLLVGALATYTDLRHLDHVSKHHPLLVEAARATGALQIQNRATIAGNIVNGSPAADTVPALMVYDARLRLVRSGGERIVPLSEFYTGYRKSVLAPDELLAEIILPPADFISQYYRKVGTRAAQAISKVVLAAARRGPDVRLAWGSVAATTVRTRRTEQAIAGGATADEACEALRAEIKPLDDIRSTGAYRMGVACNLLREFMVGATT